MIQYDLCQVTDTPVGRLTEGGARITIDSGVHHIELPDYDVSISYDPNGDDPVIEVTSPYHDPLPIDHRKKVRVVSEIDTFWIAAGVLFDECERVGGWLVGRDAATFIDDLPSDPQRSELDEETALAYSGFSTEQTRQQNHVQTPTTGIEIPPPDPESYYPWVRPFDRPVLYAYDTNHSSIDCPICGGYGRTSDFEGGIRCSTHGGFVVCHLSASDSWVRVDGERYKQEWLDTPTNQPEIERVKVVRDGQVLDLVPIHDGRVKQRTIRQFGYDIPAGPYTDVPGVDLWIGRNPETDERHIISRHETLAVRYPADATSLTEKPWGTGTQLHEGMRDYYRHASQSGNRGNSFTV